MTARRQHANRFVALAPMAIVSLLAVGCGPTGGPVGIGISPGRIYNHHRGPMFCRPTEGPGVPVYPGQKRVELSARNIAIPRTWRLASAGWGDISFEKAFEESGLKTVHFADHEYFSILGVYNRATVILYGE